MKTLNRLVLLTIFISSLFGFLIISYWQKALPALESLRVTCPSCNTGGNIGGGAG